MLLSPVTAAVSTLAGSSLPFAQAGTTPGTGGLSSFLGFTVLVLAGFLILARLSQRVVDDTDEAREERPRREGQRVGARVAPDPAPGESVTGDDPDDHGGHAGSDPTGPDSADVATTEPYTSDVSPDGVEESGPPTPAASERSRPAENEDGLGPDTRSGATSSDATSTDPTPSDAMPSETTAGEGELASIPPGALLANVALTQGLFGGVLAAAAWFFQVPATALGFAGGRVEGVAAVAVGLAFGVVLWLGNEAASALADATGAGYDEGLRQLLAPGDARGWAILLGGVLPVVALVEEFLFRAAAVGAASTALGGTPVAVWGLVVVSSLGFALGHGAQGRVGVVVTGTLGFVLAAGFVLSGSFVAVVVAHYVVNALEFLVHEGAGLPDPVWS